MPATEVITRAAVLLLSSSAEKLGLAPNGEPDLDLDEARRLITALAGLLAASQEYLGIHRQALRDGLTSVQHAFGNAGYQSRFELRKEIWFGSIQLADQGAIPVRVAI